MKEDAVSPVIAFMLLLMIVVSFISVLNAYYIPSLKEQAEIQHLHSVEESFSKLSSDVLQILTFRQNITLKEPVELGGGDVLFSPLRSSGYLEVNTGVNEGSLSSLLVSVNSNQVFQSDVNRSRIIYRPVGNFWMNQGYEWEDGVLNISKGNRKTYLGYADHADEKAKAERCAYYEMLMPRVHLDTYPSSILIDLITLEDSGHPRSVSSNGAGTIWIDLKESERKSLELHSGDTVSFQFTGSDEDETGFKSAINKTFSEWSNHNETLWNSTHYRLNIVDNSENIYPVLTLVRRNLSFYPV
ncbi:MAG: hypothetical protein V1862_06395 [Methanobacteriota archaeon]